MGDSLCPFLFTLVADSLSQIINKGMHKGIIKGFIIEFEGVEVLHFQYRDDILILIDDLRVGLRNLKMEIICFELVSGFLVN